MTAWSVAALAARASRTEACPSEAAADERRVRATSTATTVRMKQGKRLVTDGPFAETREQLGGYTLIEADNLDEAIDIAYGFFGGGDMDSRTTIEVRPVVDYKMPAAES